MKYQKNWMNSLQGKDIHPLTAIAVVSGLALGTMVSTLFFTKKGRRVKSELLNFFENMSHKFRSKKTSGQQTLGNLIEDVRGHIKQSAEGLLGPDHKRNDPSTIQVAGAASSAWKNTQEIHHPFY